MLPRVVFPKSRSVNPGVLSFRKVSKRFGAVRVLNEVDFDVTRGASFALVGENGAGKTTLIKCLLDFCHFEGGSISVQGIPSGDPAARASICFLPERFTPPWYLTGREFLSVMQRMASTRSTPDRLLMVLDEIGLDAAALDKPVRN